MNAGIGAMGPYNHANATIGRAYSLLSQNGQGGSVPGETYMGALGNPLAYSLCFRRERGAQPVGSRSTSRRACKPTDSTVSVFVGNRVHPGGLRAARHLGSENSAAASPPRRTSAAAYRDGSDRRAPVRRARHQIEAGSDRLVRARMPASPRATTGTTSGCRRWSGRARSPASSHTRHGSRPRRTTSSRCMSASEINAVVVGGETQGAWKIFGAHYVTTVSVDAWR